MAISIKIQKSAYQPRYQETAYVLSFLTMCTSNIPITLLPPFSTPSLSSDSGLSPYSCSSPFPRMFRTSDTEFDAVGTSSTYHHLVSGKRHPDEQSNAGSSSK